MQPVDDSFWDELGISWRASVRDVDVVTSRLEVRLKTQRAWLAFGTFLSASATVLGLGLSIWTLWTGWSNQWWHFLVRGTTIAVVAAVTLMTTLALRSRDDPASGSLQEMLQLCVARTGRLVRVADLGGFAVLVLAAGGTVGYLLRLRSGHGPAASLVTDLLALALVGSALLAFRIVQVRSLRRYRHLTQALASAIVPP
jgi:hypothetical protein